MPLDYAKAIADLRAGPDVQARIDELAEKRNEGQLSAAKKAEYESYADAIHLIGILQRQAKRVLANGATVMDESTVISCAAERKVAVKTAGSIRRPLPRSRPPHPYFHGRPIGGGPAEWWLQGGPDCFTSFLCAVWAIGIWHETDAVSNQERSHLDNLVAGIAVD